MTKLALNVGDRVRNINKKSSRLGWVGVVTNINNFLGYYIYCVEYTNGSVQEYMTNSAHKYLEKIEESITKCKCVHDELCERCARQLTKALTFMNRYGAGMQTLAEAYGCGRKVLKRERRNVITGMTQSDMMRQHGARGVVEFNTRATGRSTGQAFRILGEAMCNPGVAIRIQDVDHAISEGKGNRWELNKHFEHVLRDTIGERKGFTFEHGHVTFNPIVTEETYVTQ